MIKSSVKGPYSKLVSKFRTDLLHFSVVSDSDCRGQTCTCTDHGCESEQHLCATTEWLLSSQSGESSGNCGGKGRGGKESGGGGNEYWKGKRVGRGDVRLWFTEGCRRRERVRPSWKSREGVTSERAGLSLKSREGGKTQMH